jgi:hypothetical protein
MSLNEGTKDREVGSVIIWAEHSVPDILAISSKAIIQ